MPKNTGSDHEKIRNDRGYKMVSGGRYLRCQRQAVVVVEYRLPQSTTHQKKLHLCEFVTSEADESTNTHHLVSIVRVIGSRGGSLP